MSAGAGMAKGAWTVASCWNAAGTAFWNCWNRAVLLSENTWSSSPTTTSVPSELCRWMASGSRKASTREVSALIVVPDEFSSMKSVYELVGEPRKKLIRQELHEAIE